MWPRRLSFTFLLVILTVATPTSTIGCGDMPLFPTCAADGHVCVSSGDCCSGNCPLTAHTTPPSGVCTRR